jgi:hypothetical protein
MYQTRLATKITLNVFALHQAICKAMTKKVAKRFVTQYQTLPALTLTLSHLIAQYAKS